MFLGPGEKNSPITAQCLEVIICTVALQMLHCACISHVMTVRNQLERSQVGFTQTNNRCDADVMQNVFKGPVILCMRVVSKWIYKCRDQRRLVTLV